MPPMVTSAPPSSTCAAAVFGNASVVTMASAASAPPCGPSARITSGIPLRTAPIGSGTPITPVLATSTNSSAMPSCRAASAAISRTSLSPCVPVQALAFPLLTRIACATPDWIFSWLTSTGAALMAFVVNSAAADASRSEVTRARSLLDALTPQCTPAARKPFGDVTPPSTRSTFTVEIPLITCSSAPSIASAASTTQSARSGRKGRDRRNRGDPLRIEPRCSEPRVLGQAEHDIHVLHSLPARAFDQIVECGHRDGNSGTAVHSYRHVAKVGARGGLGLRQSLREDTHKRLARIGLFQYRRGLVRGEAAGQRQVRRREGAARHGNEVGREAHPPPAPPGNRQFLLDLRCVPVSRHAIGLHVFVYFRKMGIHGEPSPGSGDPRLGIDDDAGRAHPLRLQERQNG